MLKNGVLGRSEGGHYLHFEQKERINYYVVKFIN